MFKRHMRVFNPSQSQSCLHKIEINKIVAEKRNIRLKHIFRRLAFANYRYREEKNESECVEHKKGTKKS